MNSDHSSIDRNMLLNSKDLNWLNACQLLEKQGQPYAIATVIATVGSAPRASGCKMVITASAQYDTIGGGNFEYQVIAKARTALEQRQRQISIERYALSADLAQCCGGAVQVMLEFFNTQTPVVAIFGAGHVAQALSKILSELPCHIKVIDNRQQWLDQITPPNGETLFFTDPVEALDTLPDNAYLAIMTHDHALDYRVAKQALDDGRFSYIGLIGSLGKKKRFEFRLKEDLRHPERISRLICPIGHPDIKGKLPMQVAVSIAAQMIEQFDLNHNGVAETEDEHQLWQQANQARKATKEDY